MAGVNLSTGTEFVERRCCFTSIDLQPGRQVVDVNGFNVFISHTEEDTSFIWRYTCAWQARLPMERRNAEVGVPRAGLVY